jgi:maltose O-acetyltransferase
MHSNESDLMAKMTRATNAIQALPFISDRLRQKILRRAGIKIGARVKLFGQIFFGSEKCEIGDGAFISVQCLIDGAAPVKIGNDVFLAMGVRLITSTHEFGPHSRRAGAPVNAPVTIGDGCWLGAGSMVLPGVTIAPGCVIGAGAVVTQSTEPDGLYLGVPAKRVRELATDLNTPLNADTPAARPRMSQGTHAISA